MKKFFINTLFHSNTLYHKNVCYYINPKGVIDHVYAYEFSPEYLLIKEFYKEVELPRWKPKYRDYYYYFTSNGGIQQDIWDNTAVDDLYYEFGNCFKTFEEAEKVRDSIKEMLNNRA